MTTTETTPEQVAYRNLIHSLKQTIKDDSANIRAEKQSIRIRQKENGPGSASSQQSYLVQMRRTARARLLIYGTLRGKTWDSMENKHDEPDTTLGYAVLKTWQALGTKVPMPDQVKQFMPSTMHNLINLIK